MLPCIFKFPEFTRFSSKLTLLSKGSRIQQMNKVVENTGIYIFVLYQACCSETTYGNLKQSARRSSKRDGEMLMFDERDILVKETPIGRMMTCWMSSHYIFTFKGIRT